MHYSFDLTVDPTDTVSDPAIQDLKLASGKIKHITIGFPAGCARTIFCQVYDLAGQILPTNLGASYAEDDYKIEIDIEYNIDQGFNQLYLVAWSVGSSYSHTLTCYIDVQAPYEHDLGDLVLAQSQALVQLVDLLRGWS